MWRFTIPDICIGIAMAAFMITSIVHPACTPIGRSKRLVSLQPLLYPRTQTVQTGSLLPMADDMEDRLDIARRLEYHTRFLQQIAKSTADIDITGNLDDVRRSLRFISEHGSEAGGNAAVVTAKIFARTKDDETRRACLDSLSRIHSPKAKNELLRISQNTDVDKALRDLAGEYLRGTNPRVQPVAATVSGAPVTIGQP